jgi:hypothetical protein
MPHNANVVDFVNLELRSDLLLSEQCLCLSKSYARRPLVLAK